MRRIALLFVLLACGGREYREPIKAPIVTGTWLGTVYSQTVDLPTTMQINTQSGGTSPDGYASYDGLIQIGLPPQMAIYPVRMSYKSLDAFLCINPQPPNTCLGVLVGGFIDTAHNGVRTLQGELWWCVGQNCPRQWIILNAAPL